MKDRFECYWKERISFPLFPVQKKVLSDKKLLENSRNLLIVSPTSSGKSLIIEYFTTYYLSKGEKVVYVSPLKTILEEKEKEFEHPIGFFKKEMIVSTHERSKKDNYILKGKFDLVLTVYEKFGYFLQKKDKFLSDISLLIFDEFSLLEDKTRGLYVDILSTYAKKGGVRILGIASSLSDSKRLSAHLNAKLITSHKRPVPIRIGYFKNGIFYWKANDPKSTGKEKLLNENFYSEEEFFELLKFFWEEDGAIVFFPTRTKARQVFYLIKERLPVIYNEEIEKKDLPDTLFSRNINEYVSSGIGYHSRDLTYPERKFIEDLAYNGKLRLLFATTTLAYGVNMPFRNVIFADDFSIPLNIVKNMIGRAARGKKYEYGRALFLKENYTIPDTPLLIEFKTLFDLYTLFLKQIVFEVENSELYLNYKIEKEDEERALAFLKNEGLIKCEDKRPIPTILGKFVATSGVDIASFLKVKTILESSEEKTFEELIYSFMGVPILNNFYLDPISSDVYYRLWFEINEIFHIAPFGHLTKTDLKKIRKTLIIINFIENKDLIEIEEKYGVPAGILMEFFDRFIWIVDFSYRVLDFIDAPYNNIKNLKTLEASIGNERSFEYTLYIRKGRPDIIIFMGREIGVTYKQFEILKLLSTQPGRVFSYDEIMSAIWPENYDISPKQISYHKGELLKKIGKDIIKSVKGRGLYLNLLPHEVFIDDN